jgi:hypothetical protein
MAGSTPYFGLKMLLAGVDSMAEDGSKFSWEDRLIIDRLLYMAMSGHHHSGAGADTVPELVAPDVALDTSGGAMPAGETAYYRITLVSPEGIESAWSEEASVAMPDPIVAPDSPGLSYVPTGGSLQTGPYYYALSAYTDVDTEESFATNAATITIPSGTTTAVITLQLPTLPDGADGFNVYRRRPGGTSYFHVGTIPMAATPFETFVDDGSLDEDCDRQSPDENTSNQSNSVAITLPVVLPGAGWTWKVYRTFELGDYESSLLHHVVEHTFEGSGIVTTEYVDLGEETVEGRPPATSQFTPQPEPVSLTDGEEVQGRLAMANVSAFPESVSFDFPGYVVEGEGSACWVCPYPQATVVGVRCTLGRGSSPTGLPTQVDVLKGSGATPSFDTLFPTLPYPEVPVGAQVGPLAPPDGVNAELVAGDVLSVDILQGGGGATPTDENLSVVVYLYVYGWTSETSHPWA